MCHRLHDTRSISYWTDKVSIGNNKFIFLLKRAHTMEPAKVDAKNQIESPCGLPLLVNLVLENLL